MAIIGNQQLRSEDEVSPDDWADCVDLRRVTKIDVVFSDDCEFGFERAARLIA